MADYIVGPSVVVVCRAMTAVIVSVGDELVTGQTVDTNAAWLSTELTRLGVRVTRHVTVGDDADAIRGAIRDAMVPVGLVVLTGGLGPTPDDLTRQALADALDRPLEENAEAMDQVRAIFARLNRPLTESNKVQTMIPRGCSVLPNSRGTAPGIGYRSDAVQLFALPGVPAEMQAMFVSAVVPAVGAHVPPVSKRVEKQATSLCHSSVAPVSNRWGIHAANPCHWARLLCFGRSEAKIGELLGDLMQPGRNPTVGTTASRGVIAVRVLARGRDEAEAKDLIDQDFSRIRQRLGRAVFGRDDETMQDVVGRLLLERGRTVAVAESCTGGLLAKRLTDLPGSSAYFLRGYVTYSNEAKTDLLGVPDKLIAAEGAVSEPVARAMASGCRSAAGTDFALSITGIAGPGGGDPPDKPVGLVYVGLADSEGVDVRRILQGDYLSRDEIRDRSCTSALNLLRLGLLGLK